MRTKMMTRMNDISLKTKAPSEICDVVIDTDATAMKYASILCATYIM